LFGDDTWEKIHCTFSPAPNDFIGDGPSTREHFDRMPSYLQFFEMFWPSHVLRKIKIETNRYARELDDNGRRRGGDSWYPVAEMELRVFMAINFYIGMR
jgi:hypothetical protein